MQEAKVMNSLPAGSEAMLALAGRPMLSNICPSLALARLTLASARSTSPGFRAFLAFCRSRIPGVLFFIGDMYTYIFGFSVSYSRAIYLLSMSLNDGGGGGRGGGLSPSLHKIEWGASRFISRLGPN